MKWFQVDADTPHDPKVKAVLREMGVAGVGGLFLLWCHIADHGTKKPGWSLNSFGRPMPETELIIASELNRDDFLRLVTICTTTGHFLERAWDQKHVIAIPAMAARADTYTKRNVRTRVEQGSNKVRQSASTTQHKTVQHTTVQTTKEEKAVAAPPSPSAPDESAKNLGVITKIAHEAIDLEGINADLGVLADAVKSLCHVREIDCGWNSTLVRKAVDSALVQRRRHA